MSWFFEQVNVELLINKLEMVFFFFFYRQSKFLYFSLDRETLTLGHMTIVFITNTPRPIAILTMQSEDFSSHMLVGCS